MKKRNSSGKYIAGLILLIALCVFGAFITTKGITKKKIGRASNIELGLDLAGGVSITYEVDGKNVSDSDMKDTVYKLQKRVEGYSTEAEVYQEGTNRVNVDIPGVYDAEKILSELGNPGSISFCEAKSDAATGKEVLDGYCEVVGGEGIKSAQATSQKDSYGNTQYVVSLMFTDDGAKAFAEATARNIGKPIYIIYDGKIISYPTVNQAITNGQCVIEGNFTYDDVNSLATTIRAGVLKLQLNEISSKVVSAKLGDEAVKTSLMAGAIGLVIVMLIMIIAYRIPGLVASVALVLYTTLMLITLNAFDITLTLPGIAGIILGIGMAVDANVIIYARIREEIAAGLSVHAAIKSGFGKAFSAIFDGNITTLIAACVLMWLGSGSVKGFAYTLAMGIVISMFTALVVSRLVINAVYAVGVRDPKFYGVAKERKVVDFVGKRKIFFTISIILILCGPVGMLIHSNVIGDKAMNYSLEFSGGTSTNVTFNKEMDIKEIDSEITPVVEAVTGDKNVQPTKVQGTNQVVIKTRSLDLKEREALNKALEENFDVDTSLITSENISATVSNEMRRDAIVAVIVAAIFMLLYIWFRFKDIRFASSAVLALLHDVLVVLAFYVISRTSVGNTFIACMLTIVGYSINATIVIFDRIRENMKGRKKVEDEKLKEIVNASVTETLTRSIYTSLTTFVMVAILYVMGVSSIKEFAAPLMVGIIGGAYSSVCITGALWYTMKTFRKNRTAAPAAAAASVQTSSEKKAKQPSGQPAAPQQPKKKNRKRVAERLAAQEAAKQQNNEEKSE